MHRFFLCQAVCMSLYFAQVSKINRVTIFYKFYTGNILCYLELVLLKSQGQDGLNSLQILNIKIQAIATNHWRFVKKSPWSPCNERFFFYLSEVKTAVCWKLILPHLEHFWYKHMQALDSLATKANKPHFPITPWLQFSRRAPAYAGSSRAVISLSFSYAIYSLCLSLSATLIK